MATRKRAARGETTSRDATERAAALVERTRALGSATNLAGMARYGIETRAAFGVATPQIQAMAKENRGDHSLAMALWKTGFREARILAAYVADPARLTARQMDAWARAFRSWDVCDNCCLHLFRKSPLAWERALAWSSADAEFVRRAGFALMASLAVHAKAAGDADFLRLLPVIERAATDDRNFVKKAVNWALRQIGKRNSALWSEAVAVAERLARSESRSARWVGSDALRELAGRKKSEEPRNGVRRNP